MATQLPFLTRLSEADRAALAGRWSSSAHRAEELIIAHGDTGSDVFFLLEGRVRVTLFSEDGREIAYRDIGPNDIFGELAAIDGMARSASVVALAESRAARIPAAAFRELLHRHPSLAWTLLEHLSSLLRRMTDRVYEFSTLVVRQRLILELLRRAEDAHAEPGGPATLSPAPTHFELAAAISTHREAVSREMSALAKKGLVEKRGSKLLLRDLGTLEALARNGD